MLNCLHTRSEQRVILAPEFPIWKCTKENDTQYTENASTIQVHVKAKVKDGWS